MASDDASAASATLRTAVTGFRGTITRRGRRSAGHPGGAGAAVRTHDPPDTTTGGWVRTRGGSTWGALPPELKVRGVGVTAGAIGVAAALGTESATAPMVAAAAEPDITATVIRRTRMRASSRCPTASCRTCRCVPARLGDFRRAGVVVMRPSVAIFPEESMKTSDRSSKSSYPRSEPAA